MSEEEQLDLFGSPLGKIDWVQMNVNMPTPQCGLMVTIMCKPVMRKTIMRIRMELHHEQELAKAVGLCTQFLHRVPYLHDHWITYKWWRLWADLLDNGYDALITDSGRNPL